MVLINGISVSSFGASLYDRVISNNRVYTSDDWPDGALNPIIVRQDAKYRQITLTFLFLNNNENTALMNISRLTKELM